MSIHVLLLRISLDIMHGTRLVLVLTGQYGTVHYTSGAHVEDSLDSAWTQPDTCEARCKTYVDLDRNSSGLLNMNSWSISTV